MTEKTRQILLGLFLAGVLVLTVAAVGLFAAQRRKAATALGPTIISRQFGFSINMPKGWERVPLNSSLFGPGLRYIDKSDPRAGRDIFFLITAPSGTSDEQILQPLVVLLKVLDINDINFDGYQVQWSGPAQPGQYQRRRGSIIALAYQGRRLPYPVRLGLYEQITAGQQVFWCIIKGNGQLNAVDEALLDAVVASFEKIPEQTTELQL